MKRENSYLISNNWLAAWRTAGHTVRCHWPLWIHRWKSSIFHLIHLKNSIFCFEYSFMIQIPLNNHKRKSLFSGAISVFVQWSIQIQIYGSNFSEKPMKKSSTVVSIPIKRCFILYESTATNTNKKKYNEKFKKTTTEPTYKLHRLLISHQNESKLKSF